MLPGRWAGRCVWGGLTGKVGPEEGWKAEGAAAQCPVRRPRQGTGSREQQGPPGASQTFKMLAFSAGPIEAAAGV